MFFEARSEGRLGYEAVAKNVLYRLSTGHRKATSICQVVHSFKQYSYLWDDVPDVIVYGEIRTYGKLYEIADAIYNSYTAGALGGEYLQVGKCKEGASHYHRWDIHPDWADPKTGSMTKVCGRIGEHIFYQGK